MKAEITLEGPFAHTGMREPWERSTEVLAGVRDAVGPDTHLLVDVQYAFPNADTALRVLERGRSSTCTSSRRRCGPMTLTVTGA